MKRKILQITTYIGIACTFLYFLNINYLQSGKGQESHPQNKLGQVLAIFDEVGLFRKNGHVENYGVDIRQRRTKPISVDSTELHLTHKNAWIIWNPRYSPISEAEFFEIEFMEPPASGEIRITFLFRNGEGYTFQYRYTNSKFHSKKPPLASDELNDFEQRIKATQYISMQSSNKKYLWARLPDSFKLAIKDENPLISWIINVNESSDEVLKIKHIALSKELSNSYITEDITLTGKIKGAWVTPGTKVELLQENGVNVFTSISLDNHFKFDNLKKTLPISIRLEKNGRFYYTNLGRWLAPQFNREDLEINLSPEYINEDGHSPSLEKSKLVGPGKPIGTAAVYKEHARFLWGGYGKFQVYDSKTFTNNKGYLDYDRFYDNPDACYRVVHLGSSHAVALQVPVMEKYNVLMEEILGIQCQKCVEVISAGTDNGDIGANYPRIQQYARNFKPDFLLVESGSSLITQLSPTLLKEGFGWDHEHSATHNFYYNESGKLVPRLPSTEYGLYSVKPSFPSYSHGIPFFDTIKVPFNEMHPLGIEAYDYLKSIVQYIKDEDTSSRIVLHTGIDQAQCHNNCESKIEISRGKKLKIGANVFLENFAIFCNEHNIEHINPSAKEYYSVNENELLTFRDDGHFSIAGHQWLAKELAYGLNQLKNEPKILNNTK